MSNQDNAAPAGSAGRNIANVSAEVNTNLSVDPAASGVTVLQGVSSGAPVADLDGNPYPPFTLPALDETWLPRAYRVEAYKVPGSKDEKYRTVPGWGKTPEGADIIDLEATTIAANVADGSDAAWGARKLKADAYIKKIEAPLHYVRLKPSYYQRFNAVTGPAALRLALHGFRISPAHSPLFGEEIPPDIAAAPGIAGRKPPRCCTSDIWRQKMALRDSKRFVPIAKPGKAPVGKGWQIEATYDLDLLAGRWISPKFQTPQNIALCTGYGSNCWALDVDGDAGKATLAQLEAEHGPLPVTPKSLSGSGKGYHLLFAVREGMDLRNSAKALGAGLDVRGEGGQIIAPPSLHESGGRYEWAPGLAPWDVPVADAPQWLEDLAWNASKVHQAKTPKPTPVAAVADGNPFTDAANSLGRSPDSTGWKQHLALVGDGEGQLGFRAARYKIFCSALRSVKLADLENYDTGPAIEAVREAMMAQPERAAEKQSIEDYCIDEDMEKAMDEAMEWRQGVIDEEEAPAPVTDVLDAPDWRADLEALGEIPPDDETTAITWMNERFAAAPFGTSYVVFRMRDEKLVPINPEQLAKEYANRFVYVDTGKVDEETGEPIIIKKNLWAWWWKHDNRRQYLGVKFRPHAPGKPSNMPRGFLPLWKGLDVPKGFSIIRPNHTFYPRFLAHMFNNMASANEHWFAWQWCWFADILQNPQVKPGTSLVVRGNFGTGKSIVAKIFCRLIPHNWTQVTKHSELFGDFNIHLAPAVFIVVEEGFWAGSKDGYAMFKDQITNDALWVQAKFVDRCMADFYGRFFIIGNAEWIVPAHPDDRRFSVFIIGTPKELWASKAYFDPINKVEMAKGSDGLKAFAEDLLRTRIPDWIDLQNGLRTDAFQAQVDASMDLETAWMHHVIEEQGFRFKAVGTDDRTVEVFADWNGVGGGLSNQHLYASYVLFGEKSSGYKKNPMQFGKWLSNEEGGGGLLFGACDRHVGYILDHGVSADDENGRKLLPWDAAQKVIHGRDVRVHLNQEKAMVGVDTSVWGAFGSGLADLPG